MQSTSVKIKQLRTCQLLNKVSPHTFIQLNPFISKLFLFLFYVTQGFIFVAPPGSSSAVRLLRIAFLRQCCFHSEIQSSFLSVLFSIPHLYNFIALVLSITDTVQTPKAVHISVQKYQLSKYLNTMLRAILTLYGINRICII